MQRPHIDDSFDGPDRDDTEPVAIRVRVWRIIRGGPQGLFTYVGVADAHVVRAVLGHVRRLTEAVPAAWQVDIVACGAGVPLLREMQDGVHRLRRRGLRPRLAVAPRTRREVRALLAAAAAPRCAELLH